jgi:hypothetical protein
MEAKYFITQRSSLFRPRSYSYNLSDLLSLYRFVRVWKFELSSLVQSGIFDKNYFSINSY